MIGLLYPSLVLGLLAIVSRPSSLFGSEDMEWGIHSHIHKQCLCLYCQYLVPGEIWSLQYKVHPPQREQSHILYGSETWII